MIQLLAIMKITSIKTGKDHLPHLKTYDVEQFLE